MRIGVVGLGLMGGSMALALKHISFVTSIVGSDHNKEHQQIALERGLVQAIVPFETLKDECDVIFLAVPVDGVIALLQERGENSVLLSTEIARLCVPLTSALSPRGRGEGATREVSCYRAVGCWRLATGAL